MRFAAVLSAIAVLAVTGASALEKPLDIQVNESFECERKTKAGMLFHFLSFWPCPTSATLAIGLVCALLRVLRLGECHPLVYVGS